MTVSMLSDISDTVTMSRLMSQCQRELADDDLKLALSDRRRRSRLRDRPSLQKHTTGPSLTALDLRHFTLSNKYTYMLAYEKNYITR